MHMFIYTQTYIFIKLKSWDTIQIQFYPAVLTMSFFQYLIIKKMATAQVCFDTFTSFKAQSEWLLYISYSTPSPSNSPSLPLSPSSIMPFSGVTVGSPGLVVSRVTDTQTRGTDSRASMLSSVQPCPSPPCSQLCSECSELGTYPRHVPSCVRP